MAIASGALAISALVMMLISGHSASACNSGRGQLGQALDTTTTPNCNAATGVHLITILAFVVLALGCLIAAITHATGTAVPSPSHSASSPPAPPVPDDAASRLRQLRELLDAGLVTQQEHDERRAAIISSI